MSTDTNNKPYWLFWLILAVMAVLFPVFAWHENTSGFLTDDGTYLLLADFFSAYNTGHSIVEQFIMNQARFPPAFPVLIALFGGGSGSMHIAHLVNSATFIASAVALYVWARSVLGARELAAACMAVYALLPETLIYVVEIWSEFLYMTLVLATLLLLERARSVRSQRRAREILCACALFTGLAMLTRTIGVTLFAAFVVFLYLHAANRKFLYILIAVALPVFWELVKTVNGYGGGYGGDLEKYYSLDGLQALLRDEIPRNAALLLESWGRHFAVSPGSSLLRTAFAVLLLLLALAGALHRAVKRCPDVHYALTYLAVILVWPYPEHSTRFLYPLIPLVLVYMFAGLERLIPAAVGRLRPHSRPALVLLMLALIYPNALFVVDRFLQPVPRHIPEDYSHTRQWLRDGSMEDVYREADQKATVIRLLERAGQHFGPRQCVYSAHPVSTMLYSERISIITPRTASIDRLWGCRYLIVVNLHTVYEPNYPLNDVDTNRLRLLDFERDSRGRQQAFLFEIDR